MVSTPGTGEKAHTLVTFISSGQWYLPPFGRVRNTQMSPATVPWQQDGKVGPVRTGRPSTTHQPDNNIVSVLRTPARVGQCAPRYLQHSGPVFCYILNMISPNLRAIENRPWGRVQSVETMLLRKYWLAFVYVKFSATKQ